MRRFPTLGRDQGYVLVFVTFLILPMLAMVGLAVDVGSFYVRASEIQRAADAAALAGVIHQPSFPNAKAAALATAKENGFDDADADIDVVVEDVGGERLRVTVYDRDVDVFFSSAFLSNVEIVRYSTAEFVRPVPMGSPEKTFGNQQIPPDVTDPQFWAAIQAPFTRFEDGDPHATACNTVPIFGSPTVGADCNSGDTNPGYRPEGYWFGIEIDAAQVGLPVEIAVFDAAFIQRATTFTDTGDYVWQPELGHKPDTGFQLFDVDTTLLNHRDNPPLTGCEIQVEAESVGYKNIWHPICFFTPSRPGIFPLRVYTSNTTEPAYTNFPAGWVSEGQGYNSFALRTSCGSCAATDQPRIYGLGEMSILNNLGSAGSSEFFLAEVAARNTGKELEIRMFDPGDGSEGTFTLAIEGPDGNLAPICDYASDDGLYTGTLSSGCALITRDATKPAGSENLFNGQWLTITVPLTAYNCDATYVNGCWWKVRYDFQPENLGDPVQVNDRTVWQVRVIGDPVRLVS